MKKIFKFVKQNIIGFIIGGIVFGSLGVYAAGVIAANEVTYSNASSGLSSTNVKGALDELNTKATEKIEEAEMKCPSGNLCSKTNLHKTIFASKMGICINRNNILQCFKINNYDVEKKRIQQVFSDISCYIDSDGSMICRASDFDCRVYSNGDVGCEDNYDNMITGCRVESDGSADCYWGYS